MKSLGRLIPPRHLPVHEVTKPPQNFEWLIGCRVAVSRVGNHFLHRRVIQHRSRFLASWWKCVSVDRLIPTGDLHSLVRQHPVCQRQSLAWSVRRTALV